MLFKQFSTGLAQKANTKGEEGEESKVNNQLEIEG